MSIGLVVISLLISLKQYKISENLAHLNVRPEIKSYIKGSWPNYELKIYNDGPISAINFIVSKVDINVEKTKVKGKKSPMVTTYEGTGKDYDPMQKIWLYDEEFEPKESRTINLTPEFKGSKWTRIYKFDISYYRESDMENFRKTILFFADEDSIYNHSQYKNKVYYPIVIEHYFRYLEFQTELEKFMHKFDNIVPEQ